MITDVTIAHWLINDGFECTDTMTYQRGGIVVSLTGNIVICRKPLYQMVPINSMKDLRTFLKTIK